MIELNFLGRGSAFFPVLGNTSAYLEKDGTLLFLDCGESVFGMLYDRGILNRVQEVYVLITHLHADHVGSLGSLISYFYCQRNIKVQVIHPQQTIIDLLMLEGIDPQGYTYLADLPENRLSVQATAVRVAHVDNMRCYGYILGDKEDTLFYSGDSAEVAEEIKRMFFDGKIKRIFHDTSTHDRPHPTHCYYGELEKVFPEKVRDRIYCMHLDCDCEAMLMAKGFRIAGRSEEGV